MKRWMLVVWSVVLSGCMMGLLFTLVKRQMEVPTMAEQRLEFPFAVPGTKLTALNLAVYEGPFWEDGSGDPVANVTALVLRNDGEEYVQQGTVVLDTGEELLRFLFEGLEPGATILVPERDRCKEMPVEWIGCLGAVQEGQRLLEETVSVEKVDDITLRVTNKGAEALSKLVLVYKNYDSPSGIYIGGAAFEAAVPDLAPGESAEVIPYGYVDGYSRVVEVRQKSAAVELNKTGRAVQCTSCSQFFGVMSRW